MLSRHQQLSECADNDISAAIDQGRSTQTTAATTDDCAPLITVHLQNLAGDVLDIDIDAGATVLELKRRAYALRADYAVQRQRLAVILADAVGASTSAVSSQSSDDHVMLSNERTLSSYALGGDTTIHLFVSNDFCGGDYVRTIGGDDADDASALIKSPYGLCVSADGDLLFVADFGAHRVRVLRCADGALVHTIGAAMGAYGGGDYELNHPYSCCTSADGELLYVADTYNHRVQVYHIGSNFTLVRSIGSLGSGGGQMRDPSDVCCTHDGALLCVAEANGNRVQMFSVTDGVHVASLGEGRFDWAYGVCVSPSEDSELFVADYDHHCVHVFRTADATHVRTIGSHGQDAGQFRNPQGVCLSRDGEWLFVADRGNDRVQVMRASDGEHVRSIGAWVDVSNSCNIARLAQPRGVCVSPNGELLFVADAGNHRVVVFTA